MAGSRRRLSWVGISRGGHDGDGSSPEFHTAAGRCWDVIRLAARVRHRNKTNKQTKQIPAERWKRDQPPSITPVIRSLPGMGGVPRAWVSSEKRLSALPAHASCVFHRVCTATDGDGGGCGRGSGVYVRLPTTGSHTHAQSVSPPPPPPSD